MHVGGPGRTHTVQKEFYVDGKQVPIYGAGFRNEKGAPLRVMKLEARADDKKIDLIAVQ